MKRFNIILAVINILIIIAMIIHVGISMYVHSQNTDWGSPAAVELLKAVYYIIPLIIVNIIGAVIRGIIKKIPKNDRKFFGKDPGTENRSGILF